MKSWMKWTLAALALALLAGAVLRALSSRNAQSEALAAQQEALKIAPAAEIRPQELVPVRSLDLPQTLAISGPLKAINSAFVKARVAGELQGLRVREGDRVKASDIIAHIDPAEYQLRVQQAQAQAESAKAQVDIAKRVFDNNRSLVEQGFISKTALDSSMSSLAAAEATHRAALAGADVARRALEDAVLRAPISGVVSQRLAQPGERVAIEARVVEIVDLNRLELEASLEAADSLQVKIGQTAELAVEGSRQTLLAKVVRINPSALAGSRAVLAYLSVTPDAMELRQGLFAQGTLQIGSLRTLALPVSAVRTDKAMPYVQVLVPAAGAATQGQQVLHQTVRLGSRSTVGGESMVGVEGVAEGSTVLAGSVGMLREGTLTKLPAGVK